MKAIDEDTKKWKYKWPQSSRINDVKKMLMFPISPADSKQPLLNIKGTVHRSGGDLNTFGSPRTPKHRYPT